MTFNARLRRAISKKKQPTKTKKEKKAASSSSTTTTQSVASNLGRTASRRVKRAYSSSRKFAGAGGKTMTLAEAEGRADDDAASSVSPKGEEDEDDDERDDDGGRRRLPPKQLPPVPPPNDDERRRAPGGAARNPLPTDSDGSGNDCRRRPCRPPSSSSGGGGCAGSCSCSCSMSNSPSRCSLLNSSVSTSEEEDCRTDDDDEGGETASYGTCLSRRGSLGGGGGAVLVPPPDRGAASDGGDDDDSSFQTCPSSRWESRPAAASPGTGRTASAARLALPGGRGSAEGAADPRSGDDRVPEKRDADLLFPSLGLPEAGNVPYGWGGGAEDASYKTCHSRGGSLGGDDGAILDFRRARLPEVVYGDPFPNSHVDADDEEEGGVCDLLDGAILDFRKAQLPEVVYSDPFPHSRVDTDDEEESRAAPRDLPRARSPKVVSGSRIDPFPRSRVGGDDGEGESYVAEENQSVDSETDPFPNSHVGTDREDGSYSTENETVDSNGSGGAPSGSRGEDLDLRPEYPLAKKEVVGSGEETIGGDAHARPAIPGTQSAEEDAFGRRPGENQVPEERRDAEIQFPSPGSSEEGNASYGRGSAEDASYGTCHSRGGSLGGGVGVGVGGAGDAAPLDLRRAPLPEVVSSLKTNDPFPDFPAGADGKEGPRATAENEAVDGTDRDASARLALPGKRLAEDAFGPRLGEHRVREDRDADVRRPSPALSEGGNVSYGKGGTASDETRRSRVGSPGGGVGGADAAPLDRRRAQLPEVVSGSMFNDPFPHSHVGADGEDEPRAAEEDETLDGGRGGGPSESSEGEGSRPTDPPATKKAIGSGEQTNGFDAAARRRNPRLRGSASTGDLGLSAATEDDPKTGGRGRGAARRRHSLAGGGADSDPPERAVDGPSRRSAVSSTDDDEDADGPSASLPVPLTPVRSRSISDICTNLAGASRIATPVRAMWSNNRTRARNALAEQRKKLSETRARRLKLRVARQAAREARRRARIRRNPPKSNWLIPANHPYKVAWDVLTVALSLVGALVTHRSIRDRRYDQSPLVVFTECWFLLDIVLNFLTEHRSSDGRVIRDGKAVWARYLTTWFAIDALSLIPWERLYVKPIVERQMRRNFLEKSFFKTRGVVRVTRVLRGRHLKLFGRVASHTKHAGVGGKRLLRLLIKYIPKYLLFYRNMRGALAVRFLRQVHWLRKVGKYVRSRFRRREEKSYEEDEADYETDADTIATSGLDESIADDDDDDDGDESEEEEGFAGGGRPWEGDDEENCQNRTDEDSDDDDDIYSVLPPALGRRRDAEHRRRLLFLEDDDRGADAEDEIPVAPRSSGRRTISCPALDGLAGGGGDPGGGVRPERALFGSDDARGATKEGSAFLAAFCARGAKSEARF